MEKRKNYLGYFPYHQSIALTGICIFIKVFKSTEYTVGAYIFIGQNFVVCKINKISLAFNFVISYSLCNH